MLAIILAFKKSCIVWLRGIIEALTEVIQEDWYKTHSCSVQKVGYFSIPFKLPDNSFAEHFLPIQDQYPRGGYKIRHHLLYASGG